MGYKYEPPTIVKIDTHPNKQILLLAIYFLVGDFAIFFLSCEFFQADQGCLTFEQLGLLVSLRLPSKSELLLPDSSLFSCLDLFTNYLA